LPQSENGALRIAFSIDEHVPTLRKLHQKYRDRSMSLADACIVRMAEICEQHAVLTLDADFSVYRKHGRVPLPLIHPCGCLDDRNQQKNRIRYGEFVTDWYWRLRTSPSRIKPRWWTLPGASWPACGITKGRELSGPTKARQRGGG
jgi:hypothetical protein